MTALLELKEKLQILYGRYSSYIHPILKFILAFFIFNSINRSLGYMEMINSIFILLIISLLCAILPLNAIVVFGGIMIIIHTFALGLEVGGVTLILFVLMYLLYFRFTPKDALAVVMSPAAFSLGMPCIIPLGFGLLRGPGSAVSVCIGTITYYYLKMVKDVVEPLKAVEKQDIVGNIQALIGGVLDNKELFVLMIAGAAVVIIVYSIHKMSVDYAWYIAIAVGCLCYIIISAGGAILLQADISVPVILVGTIGSGLCALILEFFCFHVDYKRTEYLEYQDDAYVYYVKAVPKQAAANSGSTWHSTGNRVKKRNIPDHDEMKRKDKETSTKNLSEEGLHIAEQFRTTEKPIKKEPEDTQEIFPDIDFEAKLEETLHDIDKDIK